MPGSVLGFSVNDHFNGTQRAAAATATVAGFTLTPGEQQFASLGTTKSRAVTVCIGSNC